MCPGVDLHAAQSDPMTVEDGDAISEPNDECLVIPKVQMSFPIDQYSACIVKGSDVGTFLRCNGVRHSISSAIRAYRRRRFWCRVN
jgi:hypothetical protein